MIIIIMLTYHFPMNGDFDRVDDDDAANDSWNPSENMGNHVNTENRVHLLFRSNQTKIPGNPENM